MRLQRVEEIAPVQAIARNGAWVEHLAGTGHIPVATHDDLPWTDAVVFGTPAPAMSPATTARSPSAKRR
ncbi:hypothetical protein [Amycolatopsis sp. WQ 127309]|uniref:hypothetical protein n=1 Tax=Amycolatopsis sp. WQ 127309 TaxID=2932773 RepID=UPI001FF680B1|nr:hypothetical protein [Amycolatopsis sp. WQ 127309]UOZ05317.1 hypothetical protein MUY22_41875 [Amycolatopsis sp. WQ 127309]